MTPSPADLFPPAPGSNWPVRGTTYPSSYILTDAAPALPSSNVYKPSIICPESQSWRVPDPYDCSIYHDCYHGIDLVSYCPAQLQYNPDKQACDHAVNVQCNKFLTDKRSTEIPNVFDRFSYSGKNKCTANNEGTRFVDPTSCCHYYQCVAGKLIPQSCTHPNLFDVQTRTCLPYKRVKCDGRRQCLSKCSFSVINFIVGSIGFVLFRSLSIEL